MLGVVLWRIEAKLGDGLCRNVKKVRRRGLCWVE